VIPLLLNHLWQSTVFAAIVGLLTLLFRNNGANVRFALWFAASLKFLIPFSLFAKLGTAFAADHLNSAAVTSWIAQAQPTADPFTTTAAPGWMQAGVEMKVFAPSIGLDDLLLGIWLAGTAGLLAFWAIKLAKLYALARSAKPSPMTAGIPVRSSPELVEPGLVGIWQPVLLLPEGIEDRLSPIEMKAVIAHEMAHARRRDNLTAAIHMLVQAVFWFYPLTWWIGRRLVVEREQACDQAVVALGHDPSDYAEGIPKVCKFYLHSPLDCAAGVAGADLRRRIEAIMENRFIKSLSSAKKALLAGAAVLAIGVPVAAAMVMPPDAFNEVGRTTASPGTERALRHLIESWQRHQPDFAALTPAMAIPFMRAEAHVQREIDQSGPLKSITFRGISPEGWDIYSVAFANTLNTWNVAPLTPDGKIPTLGYWPAYARGDRTRPNPGTEAALRRQIEGWERDQPAYDQMSPTFRATMKRQRDMGHKFFDALGGLKSVNFEAVNANGWDVYDAAFEKGRTVFSIGPLTANGKVDALQVSPVFAHSGSGPTVGTEALLSRYIDALEKDTPDYGEMTPAMTALVRLDLASTQAQFRTWGKLESLKFRAMSPNGLNVYDAVFEHGHGIYQVAPLTKDGKVQWLIYDAL